MTDGSPLTFDIYCRVVDHFGDAGVTFRLARSLARLGHAARLFIDLPQVVQTLWRDAWPERVAVRAWTDDSPSGDVVVEAFGCTLPDGRLSALRTDATNRRPVWINLEYLSAEPWVEGVHGLSSPDPVSGRHKFFFCPGFTFATGGLIWSDAPPLSLQPTHRSPPSIFVFGYPAPIWVTWLAAWEALGCSPVAMAAPDIEHAATRRQDWVRQDHFDGLLIDHDIAIVRGEDSFVRAQLMGVPCLWQIYYTPDGAHVHKLNAWLDRYVQHMAADLAILVRELHWQLNAVRHSEVHAQTLWAGALQALPQWQSHARRWATELRNPANLPDLGNALVGFCLKKL